MCISFHGGPPKIEVYRKIDALHLFPPKSSHTQWLCVYYGTNKVREYSKTGVNITNTVINRKEAQSTPLRL